VSEHAPRKDWSRYEIGLALLSVKAKYVLLQFRIPERLGTCENAAGVPSWHDIRDLLR
jgi:hypothetical protein